MPNRIDRDLEVELHDVFHVQQVTRDTPIEEAVGADLVTMESGQSSQTHRHNFSETVLFFLGGEATVFINDTPHARSEEHTSELQSLMRISYAVFCLKKNKKTTQKINNEI